VLAAVIAISLIGAYVLTQGSLLGTSSVVNSTTQSTQQSSSTAQQSNGQTGNFAVLMTDPPTIPIGVTAVYINYTDVSIHVHNAGNQTGWTNLQTSGAINLLSVVNSTQTIATANISSGIFNALRFNITSAVVTFQGQNYTADLVYQEAYLFVAIPGGISIVNGTTSGAVIDMTPTVLLLGNTTDPTFAFMPEAKGYTLAANSISIHPHTGDRTDYQGQIWTQIHEVTHFQITAVSLTPSSFSITVQNTGAATVNFRIAALTSTTSISGGWVPASSFGSISKISEFFVVVPNGSLVALNATTYKGMFLTLALAGYTLAPHESATFTYNGQITIGALSQLQGKTPTQSINVGQNYVTTIVGSGLYAQSAVIANSAGSTSTTNSTTTTITSTTSTTSSSTTSSTTSSTSTSSTSTASSTTSSTSSVTSTSAAA
jgi:hypothetical protein